MFVLLTKSDCETLYNFFWRNNLGGKAMEGTLFQMV